MSYIALHEITRPAEDELYLEYRECAFCGIHSHAGNMLFDEETGKDFCNQDCLTDWLLENAEEL
jgi:hypothetical protein